MTTVDVNTLVQVAGIVVGFAATTFVFRLNRELEFAEKGLRSWIPGADWLLMSATFICVIFIILPIMWHDPVPEGTMRVARVGCAASFIMMAGWFPAILAHYGWLPSTKRSNPPKQVESIETGIILVTIATAVAFSIILLNG